MGFKMQQCEDNLYIISIDCPTSAGNVKFKGVFQQVPEISARELVPAENGTCLEVKFDGEK